MSASSSSSPFLGKRVLVTGGANGLGKAIVKKFYEEGAKVFVVDRDEVGLENLKQELPNVETRVVDLLDWDKSKAVVEELLPLNHLVNNAGIAQIGRIMEVTSTNFDQVFGVNVRAAFNLTQVFASGVLEHKLEGGTVVNISSVADNTPLPGAATYNCSKAAITMLTKCCAADLAKHNIRVNCVRPTAMHTELLGTVGVQHPELLQEIMDVLGRQVIKSPLETSHVADSVLFLSGPQSSMITGEGLTVDAGFTVG